MPLHIGARTLFTLEKLIFGHKSVRFVPYMAQYDLHTGPNMAKIWSMAEVSRKGLQ